MTKTSVEIIRISKKSKKSLNMLVSGASGRLCGGLGVTFGDLWEAKGGLGRSLGRPGASLGGFGRPRVVQVEVLGSFGGGPGAALGSIGGRLGSARAAKTEK